MGGGEQLRPVEDRVGTGDEAQRLRLLAHVFAPGREPHDGLRHAYAGRRDGADEIDRIDGFAARQRRTLDLDQHVDRHTFGMDGQARKRRDHADAIIGALTHPDDAAAADVDAGLAHVAERVEAVLIGARGDDRAVIFRRGIEVVVVIVEAGRLEPPRLVLRPPSERGAGPEPDRFDTFAHRADLLEIAVLRLAPRRAHAEAARTRALGRPRLGEDGIDAHQLLRLDARVIVHALRTIGAVFRTAAGL